MPHLLRLALLAALLAGCAVSPLPPPTSIPILAEPEGYPSRTPAPSLKGADATASPLPSRTPSPSPGPQPTPTPLPTLTPTTTPLPPRLADPAHPGCELLVYAPFGQGEHPTQWVIADRTGAEYSRLNLPELPGISYWQLDFAPDGRHVLAYVSDIEWMEGVTYEIKIFRLPEATLVRSLPLLPPGKTKPTRGSNGDWVNSPYPQQEWSPDGHWLDYVAVDESEQVNIHIYDTLLDHDRQLTYQIPHPIPWTWTPDSLNLLIAEIEFPGIGGFHSQGYWLLNLQGEARSIPAGELLADQDQIAGWISNETMLLKAIYHESPDRNLREINLRSGETKTLFKNSFSGVAIDPDNDAILLGFAVNPGNFHGSSSRPPGIYRLVGPESLVPLLSGETAHLWWQKELRQFVVVLSGQPGAFTIDAYGQVKRRLPDEWLQVSPNGQWVLSGGTLLAADDSPVAEVDGFATWLPDSSGFYQVHPAGEQQPAGLYLFQAANHWQPKLVTNDISPKTSLQLVNRCPGSY
jgi:hypothetical protein